MRLVFDDPELERVRHRNVPDDATVGQQVEALMLEARRAYEETSVSVEKHRAIAASDGLLRMMVGTYGARLVPMPMPTTEEYLLCGACGHRMPVDVATQACTECGSEEMTAVVELRRATTYVLGSAVVQ